MESSTGVMCNTCLKKRVDHTVDKAERLLQLLEDVMKEVVEPHEGITVGSLLENTEVGNRVKKALVGLPR